MARSKSSGKWLKEHFDDQYVKKAQKEGYRSRACYKLLELQEKDRLIRPGMTVLDLGAAPGSWSQVAAQLVGDKGRVVASDILPIDSLADVEFLQGDFTEESVYQALQEMLGEDRIDLVISDMAPNMSGLMDVDQPRIMMLVELALDMALQVLAQNGNFVAKVFQGEGFDELVKYCRTHFTKVVVRKPAASRPRSREVYLVAKGLRQSA